MRRSSRYGADPNQDDGFLARLRASAANLWSRDGRRRQAMPLDHYRGQPAPVVPYHERRQQLVRSRRQHSSYALVFVVVLLVLVVGIFYGLTWALGGVLSFSGSPRPTATIAAQPTAPAALPTTAGSPAVLLPTAGPGGASPSPSPGPVGTVPASSQPTPGPGTPAPGAPGGRTYTVKPGDTPSTIARQFNVSTEDLMRANNITDPRALKVGQVLTIPPEATPTSATR